MGKSNIPKIDCLPSNLGKIHHQVWCTGRVKMTEAVNRTVNAYFEIDRKTRKYRGVPTYLEVHPYFKIEVNP